MKFLPQCPKYYKKTAALTDIIAVAIIWAIALNPPTGILSISAISLLSVWIYWGSGILFTELGEWVIKNRNENKD